MAVITVVYRVMMLLTGDQQQVNTEMAYVNVLTRGDLSSLQWIESPLKYFDPAEHQDRQLCTIHYSALNFRDVMLATGKLQPDAIPGKLSTTHLNKLSSLQGRSDGGVYRYIYCLLYTSPSPRDRTRSRMPSSA